MKYKAIIETDDFKDFKFFEDGLGKYICGIDAGAVNNEWIPLYFTEYKQQPCEDCISRQAVLDEINRIGIKAFETYNDYSELYDFVDGLPFVTPKEKIGRWIDITNKNGTVIAVRCDCCENSPKHAIRSDFCPNCGARMIEPQKSEVGE